MGWFKSQLLKIIEWKDDTKDTIVYRFPMFDGKKEREIMRGSSLTVRESQAAVFVNRGQIADVFGPGEYKLETRTLPILTSLGHIFYDGDSKFKAEVYFVNTKQFTNQKWGTANPITMRDADFGVIRIRGYGVFSFRVINPALFLKALFGTNSQFTVDDINQYLKSMLISCITDTIAESKVSALDLASNLQEFNDLCQSNIQHKFEELGLSLTNLTIENISFPENIEKALDERATLGILGDKMGVYAQKKAADALGTSSPAPPLALSMRTATPSTPRRNPWPARPWRPPPSPAGSRACSPCGTTPTGTAPAWWSWKGTSPAATCGWRTALSRPRP